MAIISNVHYRHLADMSEEAPATSTDATIDVTDRLCVPCAIVGNCRQASTVSDDAVPLCAPHGEFYWLSQIERDEITEAWAGLRSGTAVRQLFRLYRQGHATREAQPVRVLGGAA